MRLHLPGQDPVYTGTWTQPSNQRLQFQYFENGNPIAEFDGWAVDGSCYEGLTIFPGSPYVSPYEVCLQ